MGLTQRNVFWCHSYSLSVSTNSQDTRKHESTYCHKVLPSSIPHSTRSSCHRKTSHQHRTEAEAGCCYRRRGPSCRRIHICCSRHSTGILQVPTTPFPSQDRTRPSDRIATYSPPHSIQGRDHRLLCQSPRCCYQCPGQRRAVNVGDEGPRFVGLLTVGRSIQHHNPRLLSIGTSHRPGIEQRSLTRGGRATNSSMILRT